MGIIPVIRILPFDLVIFECAGVLVDSDGISDEVLAAMLTEQGLPTSSADARRRYQGKLPSQIHRSVERRTQRDLPIAWLDELERRRGEAFARQLRAMPGAAEVVEGIRAAGIDVCVASQCKLASTRLSLGLTGLRRLFDDDALFSGESVQRGKPYPDLLLHIARCRDASPRGTAVVDGTALGIEATVAAKMRPFGYTVGGDANALRKAGAKDIVESLEELPELLGV